MCFAENKDILGRYVLNISFERKYALPSLSRHHECSPFSWGQSRFDLLNHILTVLSRVGSGIRSHLPPGLVNLFLPLLPARTVDLRRGNSSRLRRCSAYDTYITTGGDSRDTSPSSNTCSK